MEAAVDVAWMSPPREMVASHSVGGEIFYFCINVGAARRARAREDKETSTT